MAGGDGASLPPREVELKLTIGAESLRAFRSHPVLARFAIDPARRRLLRSLYFDTSDSLLQRHGAALRVRRIGGKWIQTFKCGGTGSGGLHTREEHEMPVRGPAPDLAALQASTLSDEWKRLLARRRLRDRLIPRFETRFQRTWWTLRVGEGQVVEVALDVGAVADELRSEPISEIEIELKEGDSRALFDIARLLLDRVDCRVEPRSKSERGYALVTAPAPRGVKARHIVLAADEPLRLAIGHVIRGCLDHMLCNERGVRDGADRESIHQMRVGLRRLRFAMRLFRDVVPHPSSLREELQWLASVLGAARDWQVFAGATLPAAVEGAAGVPHMDTLASAASNAADAAAATAAEAVCSRRFTRALVDLLQWLAGVDASANPELDASLRRYARKSLRSWRRRVGRRQAEAAGNGGAARHLWRIALKKLRYATEFFRDALHGRRARTTIDALTALQDAIGLDNDRIVGLRLLHELVAVDARLADPARFVEGWLAAARVESPEEIERLWSVYLGCDVP